eukprot:TRINITY_DN815_c0_g1_i1.p1 TRINITY_DN815_c0_g1~~TRINITY_DN815_c0_g1_i1.p1  ORF type:complete len:121 (+),score=39.03 TRINITY_DN815_c0_g1_i1:93-455(+)
MQLVSAVVHVKVRPVNSFTIRISKTYLVFRLQVSVMSHPTVTVGERGCGVWVCVFLVCQPDERYVVDPDPVGRDATAGDEETCQNHEEYQHCWCKHNGNPLQKKKKKKKKKKKQTVENKD